MERDVHNQLKTQTIISVGAVVNATGRGRLYGDKMRLVHPEARLSNEADGLYVKLETLHRQRAQLRQGKDSLELVGSPDMVLEVVSPTSVHKDTVLLLDLYHRAGIREYWLVNPLEDVLDFQIYRYSAKKFVSVRAQDGWLRSTVFDRSFRLTEATNELNLPDFRLAMR